MRKNTSITVTLGAPLLRFSAILLVCACHGPEVPPAEYPPLDPVPSTVIEANPTTAMTPPTEVAPSGPSSADAGASSASPEDEIPNSPQTSSPASSAGPGHSPSSGSP